MQNFNSSQKSCQNEIAFEKNEIFRSSEIFLCQIRDSVQANNKVSFFGKSFVQKNYGPSREQFVKVETSSKETSKISTKNFSDDFKNSLMKQGMCTSQSLNSNSAFNFLISTAKSDILKNLANSADEKTNNPNIRSKEIICINNDGHAIKQKDEFCCEELKKSSAVVGGDCDPNDNIINIDKLNCEMYDINDNANDKINIQEDESSLSDNAHSGKSDCEAPCGIGLLERLIRSHPVWFLPGIQRAGAVHLLQGKEEGNFIVRQSSQPDTMAVSVRLPTGKGPYIEHYLIQAVDGQLSLESSENMFGSIPSLIAHYCQCCDELPVRLTLPLTIREAKNRQQLSSLALLGQEFWRYPMANLRSDESQNSSPNNNKFDSLCCSKGKKVIKENEEIVLDLVPLNHDPKHSSLLSTFKTSPVSGVCSITEESKPKRPHTLDLITTNIEKSSSVNDKSPPQPPPRWTKPAHCAVTSQSSFNISTDTSKINLINSDTIFNENDCTKAEITNCTFFTTLEYDMSSPKSDQTNMNSFGFKRDKNSLKHFQEENKLELISPISDNTNLISKSLEIARKSQHVDSVRSDKLERVFKRYKKEAKIKESAHYQESDILESPTLYYYKSNVADKQSDYEDIWATDSFTTFKPNNASGFDQENYKSDNKSEPAKPPDLLERLENSFRMSFKEKKDEKTTSSNDLLKECSEFDGPNMEEYDPKQSSPFYAEPADALVVRRKGRLSFNKSRHSDPFSFNNWSVHMNPYLSGGNILGRIDSQNDVDEELNCKAKSSLSFDNIINLKKKEIDAKPNGQQKAQNAIKAKPVRPPKIHNMLLEKPQQNWAVDSSWEFIGNEVAEKENEGRFPSIEQQMDSDEAAYKDTVEEMIAKRFPQFKIPKRPWSKSSGRENFFLSHQLHFQKLDPNKSCSRISAYDNLSCDRFNFSKSGNDSDKSSEINCDSFTNSSTNYDQQSKLSESENLSKNHTLSETLKHKRRLDCGSMTEDNEDAQTIFSEPWDSSRWENLLPSSADCSKESCFGGNHNVEATFTSEVADSVYESTKNFNKITKKGYKEKMDFPLSLQSSGLKTKDLSATGASIRSYALHLASDKSTTFAQNIDNFIECTLESKEANPQIVMRNMRQFMSGMKNYLVKHGEREFEKQVEKERMKLKSTEFLNLDAILEGVMHKLVVRPLREHLYKLFVDEYVRNGAIQLLYENLNYARTKSLRELGLKTKITPPSQEALEMICHFISKLQDVDSPLEKLDHLLASASTIIYSVKHSNQGKTGIAFGADDILPLFVWVLVQSGFIAAEIEAEYMWGLLHPSLLSGEGCYYLTTLSSAVHVLKNFKSCGLDQANKLALNQWQCGDLKSVLKIIVPDELHGSILTKTLPVKPNMTTKDVCKIIAHKIRITNPQDYGLFRLVDGEETLLNDLECPQDVKSQLIESGKHCTLAYKRIDAKIGWPRTA